MSELLRKHQQSCEAAENLITRDRFFAASVHCSYYSCIQLMKHVFLHKNSSITAAQLDDAMNAQGGGGTHNYLRKEMKKKLKRFGVSRPKAAEFENNLLQLKQTRIEADYNETVISEPESREA